MFLRGRGIVMHRKDSSVETEFHPIITAFLFQLSDLFIGWGYELVITSGSEMETKHSRTSLHYATPAQAVDIRNRHLVQLTTAHIIEEAKEFCIARKIPTSWIEVIEESDHIHIEYQPKRQDNI